LSNWESWGRTGEEEEEGRNIWEHSFFMGKKQLSNWESWGRTGRRGEAREIILFFTCVVCLEICCCFWVMNEKEQG